MSENGKQQDEPQNGVRPDWIRSIHLKYFTAFEDITIDFSPGINFIIGENGTGKTHLLKVMYFFATYEMRQGPADGIESYFFCQPTSTGRWNLINQQAGDREATVEITSSGNAIRAVHYRDKGIPADRVGYTTDFSGSGVLFPNINNRPKTMLVTAKEMLSHNKGFVATAQERILYFERHYQEMLSKAEVLPLRNGGESHWQHELMSGIEEILGGPVRQENGIFFVATSHGSLEFTLVAEGHRKLALYWLLLNNGMLDEGTILFIDEPEANLNPRLMDFMTDLLLELSRHGVQIFVASHSYVMLKHFEQKSRDTGKVRYHVLYRDDNETRTIRCLSVDDPLLLEHDPILDAYNELYDRDIQSISERIRSK